MARLRIHNALVDRLALTADDVVLDLGCGNGLTLATAATRVPGVALLGLDVDRDALAGAAAWLHDLGARHQLVVADVGGPLPVRDAGVSRVVCHDVLEHLEDPVGLMVEAHRVLVPRGVSVWSHVDYDSVVVSGADRRLTRRVLQAYGEASPVGSDRSDAQMGRKVAALVARSPLVRTGVDASVLVATDLDGPGRHRINDIVATVRAGAGLPGGEIERWEAELAAAAGDGRFLYAQTAFLVTAEKRA